MEIHISGHPLRLKPSVFNSRHGTVLDSGTTYAYLPQEAFVKFRDAILARVQTLKQIPGPDPTYKDICFSGAGSEVSQLSEIFPEVEMVFSNDQKISLSPENYLFRHSKVHSAYCLGVFQNGQDSTTLLGGIVVRNTLVTYDRENQRIGFWKTNCSELWERLHFHGLLNPPSDSSYRNSTLGPSLVPPAEGPPIASPENMTGPTKFGLLGLNILLNVTSSYLESHVSDFAELLAHYLKLNSSEVQILSIKGEGNATRVRLLVFPVGIDTSHSNATIRDVVSRLTAHHVHLPEKFGHYELLEWKIEPVSPRTWWQQHAVAIVLGVAVTLLLSFGTLFGWFLRRRRQRNGAYLPVDAPVPEQELQPLETT